MYIFQKHKETILYLIFGVLSTIVNIATYLFFTRVLKFEFIIANIIAWIVAVIFAYITNKFFVFESKSIDPKFILKEFTSFASCRIFSGGLELVIMYVMIDMLLLNDVLVKVVTNVIVIVLNYIFSKLIIFSKINNK